LKFKRRNIEKVQYLGSSMETKTLG